LQKYKKPGRQMYRKTNVHTYIPTVHKTDIHTDRQTGQTDKIDKQTYRQKDREYMSVV
jgi:hypothetical protein